MVVLVLKEPYTLVAQVLVKVCLLVRDTLAILLSSLSWVHLVIPIFKAHLTLLVTPKSMALWMLMQTSLLEVAQPTSSLLIMSLVTLISKALWMSTVQLRLQILWMSATLLHSIRHFWFKVTLSLTARLMLMPTLQLEVALPTSLPLLLHLVTLQLTVRWLSKVKQLLTIL